MLEKKIPTEKEITVTHSLKYEVNLQLQSKTVSRSGIHYSLNDPISLIYHFTFLLDLFRSIQNPAKHLRWGVFQNRVNA